MSTLNIHVFPKALAIFALLGLSACASADIRPNARILKQVPKQAPALYQQGWKDGCESGMTAGNELYKAVYKNKIDQRLVSNAQYYQGWTEAQKYCAHYTMATLWEGGVLGTPPSEERLIPEQAESVFGVAASWGRNTVFKPDEEESGEEFALLNWDFSKR